MSDFRARLHEEYVQLQYRIEKLTIFIVSEKYDDLPEIERKALKSQLLHMQSYFDVLSGRVSRLCN